MRGVAIHFRGLESGAAVMAFAVVILQFSTPRLADAQEIEASDSVKVRVLDDTGNAVGGASIRFRAGGKVTALRSDAAGIAMIKLPENRRQDFHVQVFADYVSQRIEWKNSAGDDPPPAELVFRLRRGVTIGGRVLNEKGEPLKDATVQICFRGKQREGELATESLSFSKLKTDRDGKWNYRKIPREFVQLRLYFQHPDCISDNDFDGRSGVIDKARLVGLKEQEDVRVLHPGIAIRGVVTDPEGRPVVAAMIGLGPDPFGWVDQYTKSTSDENGEFAFLNAPRAGSTITVFPSGFAPQLIRVSARDQQSVNVKLERGREVAFQVVDAADEPIANARVELAALDDLFMLKKLPQNVRNPLTNAAGEFVWKQVPNTPVIFKVSAAGFESELKRVGPDDGQQKIILKRTRVVRGRVVAKSGGKPVESFHVTPARVLEERSLEFWQTAEARVGKDGYFEFVIPAYYEGARLRIDAIGFAPLISDVLDLEDLKALETFQLKALEPVVGTVLNPKGEAIAECKVFVCPQHAPFRLSENGPGLNECLQQSTTAMGGQFQMVPRDDDYNLVVYSNEGFARVTGVEFVKAKRVIQLSPWSAIKVKLKVGETARPFGTLHLFNLERAEDRDGLRIDLVVSGVTDSDGEFEWSRIPPNLKVAVAEKLIRHNFPLNGWDLRNINEIDTGAGRVHEVVLGGKGRIVRGKFAWSADHESAEADLDFTQAALIPADRVGELGGHDSPAIPGAQAFEVNADGSFQIDDVPPGEYVLRAFSRDRVGWRSIAVVERKFEVGAAEVDKEKEPPAVDLEVIELTKVDPKSEELKID